MAWHCIAAQKSISSSHPPPHTSPSSHLHLPSAVSRHPPSHSAADSRQFPSVFCSSSPPGKGHLSPKLGDADAPTHLTLALVRVYRCADARAHRIRSLRGCTACRRGRYLLRLVPQNVPQIWKADGDEGHSHKRLCRIANEDPVNP